MKPDGAPRADRETLLDRLTQKALKLETLKGFTPGHLATVGRRALGGSYDF